jgi:hypothetical protein
MRSALWLLLFLHLKSWGRYLVRSLATVKGALLIVLGLLVFAPMLLQVLLQPANGASRWGTDAIRTWGPGCLLLYCLVNFFFSSGERGIYFSPAEVHFLFTGPFSRRQLLAYKVVMLFLLSLPAALILSLVLRVHAASYLSALLAVALVLLFMNLVTLALNLLTLAVDARLYTRLRRALVLGLLVAVGIFLAVEGGSRWREIHAGGLLERLVQNPVYQAITFPLRGFVEVFLAGRPPDGNEALPGAESIWPGLLAWTPLALAVNGVLLVLVFWLDANYLESAATASARVYARLQRLRSGNILAGDGGAVKVRFTLPELPWWGGIGPILWRQLLTAVRGLGRLTIVFLIFGGMLIAPLVATTSGEQGGTGVVLGVVAGMTLWLTIMLTALVPFDFRGDVDRMAVLKSLPIPAWRMAVGQLLTPTLLLSCLQWLVLVLIAVLVVFLEGPAGQPVEGRRATLTLVAAGAAFVFPFNFLLFGLENLLFLLFPARMLASTPGDFQAVGRNVLFMMAKLFGIGLVAGVAAMAGVLGAMVGRSLVLGVALAWLVVAGCAATLIPAVAVAYNSFDVGRDTPP